MQVTKIVHIQTAHRLKDHKGQCRFIHGHSYKIELTIEDGGNDSILMDFHDMKSLMMKEVGPWDHALLLEDGDPLLKALSDGPWCNVVVLPKAPTAEVMADILVRKIAEADSRFDTYKVTVWETITCFASASLNGAHVRAYKD